jgi:hypothetical protein
LERTFENEDEAMSEQKTGNPFVHMELNAKDLGKAKAFYGEMFGWEIQDNDMGPAGIYATFKPADGPGGGMFSIPDAPGGWLPYVGVEEINAATEKAKSLGATVHVGPHEIPNVGWFTVMTDPDGARIAIFQAKM